MSYRIITATLKARTAIHIGTGEGNDLTDALLRRDAQGRPFIPGTAIAGALRSLLTRLAPRLGSTTCAALEGQSKSCSCPVCHLFGDINPTDEEGAESAASRIFVFNAYPTDNTPAPLIRDGVGIDRAARTAARAGGIKYDLEVIPAGAEFKLRMELRDPSPEDERLLAVGLSEWQAGRFWLGGRVARGLGAFELLDLEYKTLPLNTPEGLMAFLQSDEPESLAQPEPNWLKTRLKDIHFAQAPKDRRSPITRCWVLFTGTLQAEGAFLTNDVMVSRATGFDHAPLLAQWGDWGNPVLPGSSLRGVLRFHAERLARTLTTLEAWKSENQTQFFLERCPACDPNVHDSNQASESESKEKKKKPLPLESCDSVLRKNGVPGTEIVGPEDLCLACRLFGSTRRGSRLIVEDASFKGDRPILKMLDFLAIDRFTGGGAEGLKFDALALWKPAFTLRIHLENPERWELGWLALVLRDLAEGWLQVGFGASKGFGWVRLKDFKATFGCLLPEDVSYLNLPLKETRTGTSGIYTTFEVDEEKWREIAQGWVQDFVVEVERFRRTKESSRLTPYTEDHYFGKVHNLYPVWVQEGDQA